MKHESHRIRRSAAALAVTLAGGAGALGLASTAAAHATATSATTYTFTTLDNQADPATNELLGINSHNVIAGYFGVGSSVHPFEGYLLDPPYGQANYVNENFPGSAQTQVTGINNRGDTVGFWANAKHTQRGFVEWNGVFKSFTDPRTPHVAPSSNQLLGVNDLGVAVGFYVDAANASHAYEVNQATGVFTAIKIPGAVSTEATGINNLGDIVGFGIDAAGNTSSWLLHDGHLTTYQFPNGHNTVALGVNDHDEIVGFYVDEFDAAHGFTLKAPLGPVSHWQSIDDPNGFNTTVNGVNDADDLVGYSMSSDGATTNGMLAQP
jgi:hypothetical protein